MNKAAPVLGGLDDINVDTPVKEEARKKMIPLPNSSNPEITPKSSSHHIQLPFIHCKLTTF